MLKECRQALRITTEAYDGELCSLMEAGARDLEVAGVKLPGTVSFQQVTVTTEVGTGTDAETVTTTHWEDDSKLRDALVMRAIFTYARMMFGSPDDYERVKESYGAQKVALMHATGYTDYGEDGEEA